MQSPLSRLHERGPVHGRAELEKGGMTRGDKGEMGCSMSVQAKGRMVRIVEGECSIQGPNPGSKEELSPWGGEACAASHFVPREAAAEVLVGAKTGGAEARQALAEKIRVPCLLLYYCTERTPGESNQLPIVSPYRASTIARKVVGAAYESLLPRPSTHGRQVSTLLASNSSSSAVRSNAKDKTDPQLSLHTAE